MKYDIITLAPTVSTNAHAVGDVMFNLTEIQLPKRAVLLKNVFMEVAAGGGEDDTKISLLFFRDNKTPSLGTLNATANISASGFTGNQYIGAVFLGLTDADARDLDVIDNTALYYGMTVSQYANNARGGSGTDEMILGQSRSKDFTAKNRTLLPDSVFVAGVVHSGAPDFDGTDNVKIHLHIEY